MPSTPSPDTSNASSTPPRFETKILAREACVQAVKTGSLPRPLVFTNGVFDIVHRGHVSYLDAASRLGATLIVALNTDASVRSLGKGDDRPINTLDDRAAVVAALESVAVVTCFDEHTPEALIRELRPDVIVKGGDYDMESLPETAAVKSWGGRAVAIPIAHARSTTTLLGKIRAS